MKRAGLLLLVLGALAAAACNDNNLTAGALSSPTPPPSQTPTGPGPIAIITASPPFAPLDDAIFDGSPSYDPSGSAITAYAWAVDAAPSGSQAHLVQSNVNGSQQTLFLDVAGDYTVRLTVTNAEGLTGTTTYSFSAVPTQGLHVELLWPAQYSKVDMDLHLVNTGAGGKIWDAQKDCNWTNCVPGSPALDWGAAGNTLDDPSLDIDNIMSYVPENTNVKEPADGTYAVCVHYFGSTFNDIPTDNEVRVYLNQQSAYDGTRTLTATNQVWYVGDIACAGGSCTFTTVDTQTTTTPGTVGATNCGN